MRIVHLTTHMGGGIGQAISSLVQRDSANHHTVLCLQKPEKDRFIRLCQQSGRTVLCEPSQTCLTEQVAHSDVCIIHWWGHPVMAQMFANFPAVPIRGVLWSHVNGLYYPWLSPELVEPTAAVFLTSSCSLEAAMWQQQPALVNKAQVVFGLGDLSRMHPPSHRSWHDGPIRVGYVGSFVKSKIHPDFVDLCERILRIEPNIRFVLAGDPREYAWIVQQARSRGILSAFELAGYVEDVPALLSSLDIFAYPLNPTHFGTTENAILEAMAMQLPVVLLDQPAERAIVTHLKNGILARDIEDFAAWVHRLASEPDLRLQLGQTARETMQSQRTIEGNLKRFHQALQMVVAQPKKILTWPAYQGKAPWQWFFNAVRPDMRAAFLEHQSEEFGYLLEKMPVFCEPSKGSIPHFHRTFPQDPILAQWSEIVAKIKK